MNSCEAHHLGIFPFHRVGCITTQSQSHEWLCPWGHPEKPTSSARGSTALASSWRVQLHSVAWIVNWIRLHTSGCSRAGIAFASSHANTDTCAPCSLKATHCQAPLCNQNPKMHLNKRARHSHLSMPRKKGLASAEAGFRWHPAKHLMADGELVERGIETGLRM